MAEREACTDAVDDLQKEKTGEETKKNKKIVTTTTKTVVKKGKEDVESADEDEEEDEDDEEESGSNNEGDGDDDESEYEEIEVVEVVEVDDDEDDNKIDKKHDDEDEDDEDDDDDDDDDNDDDDDVKNRKDKKSYKDTEQNGSTSTTTTTKITKKIIEPNKAESRELSDKKEEGKSMEKEQLSSSTDPNQEGESLLLPLLQGLLHKNMPPVRNQSSNNSNNNTLNNNNKNIKDTNNNNNNNNKIYNSVSSDSSGNSLDYKSEKTGMSRNLSGPDHNTTGVTNTTFHHVEDSGTESGEDLKLIAAGLRNTMHANNDGDEDDRDLIGDVTVALKRLEASLRDGKDLKLDTSKRNALLVLVGRLQTGLIAPDKITAPTPGLGNIPNDENADDEEPRRGSRSSQRFAKRRNRANRHTVGVSREELADARRYIEEMVMMENMSNCTTPEANTATTPPEFVFPIEKQPSVGSVVSSNPSNPPESVLFRPNQFLPDHLKDNNKQVINNDQHKPPDNIAYAHVQMRDKKPKNAPLRQSLSLEQHALSAEDTTSKSQRPLSESSLDVKDIQKLAVETTPVVLNSNTKSQYNLIRDKNIPSNVYNPPSSSTEPDKGTIEQKVQEKNLYNKTHHSNQPNWGSVFNGVKANVYPAEAPNPTTDSSKSNKFINKKLMMKRANTIDIPKPMKYINDMDSDSDAEQNGLSSTKTIGLRGTVQVNIKHKPKQVVPAFQPKTENDHKFLAFIQKQSPTNNTLGWNSPAKPTSSNATNWSNKFGNIKNTFEAGANATTNKPPMPATSARNFWKKAEANSAANTMQQKPKIPSSPISKTGEKVVKPPWADVSYNNEIVTGSLRIKEPPPPPRVQSESPKIVIPKPIPVNKFSHAPMSAFKPVAQPKVEPVRFKPITSEEIPRPITNGSYSEPINTGLHRSHYSPSRPAAPLYSQNTINRSPTVSTPWAAQPSSGQRVLSLAASKFERKSPNEVVQQMPRRQSYHEQEPIYQDRVPATYDYNNKMVQKVPQQPVQNPYQYNNSLNAPGLVRAYQNMNQSPSGYIPPDHMIGNQQKEIPPIPYVCTDYTQPSSISTYAPENKFVRQDSLVNPNAQPLVLTSQTPIISPIHQQKPDPLKTFDYASPSPTTYTTTQYETSDDGLDSSDIVEYKAESKVMRAPIGQQAVTVTNRTSHVGNQQDKNSQAAKNLLSVMKDISVKPVNNPNVPSNNPMPTSNYKTFQGTVTDVVFPVGPTDDNILATNYQGTTQPVRKTYQQQYGNRPQQQPNYGGLMNYQAPVNQSINTSSLPSTPLVNNNPQYSNYARSLSYQSPAQAQALTNNYQHQQSSYQPKSQQPTSNLMSHDYRQAKQNQIPMQQTNQYPEPTNNIQHQQTSYQPKSQQQPTSNLVSHDYRQGKQNIPMQQTNKYPEPIRTNPPTENYSVSNSYYNQEKQSTRAQLTNKPSNYQQNKVVSSPASYSVQKTNEIRKMEPTPNVQSYSMPHYQKNLTSSAIVQPPRDSVSGTSTNEPPTKASAPKTEKIPVFKKFGPAQPHLYHPNSYQYPLAPQPTESKNRFQNRVGSTQAPRKFSEPEIKFSEYQTKQNVQSKSQSFVTPKIIETPSTPITASKNELPSNIVFNNIGQRPIARQTVETSHEGESVVSYKFPIPFNRPSVLSKSDSWHQICQQTTSVKPPSPKSFQSHDGGINPLRRVKSGHALTVPKMYEAGIDKSQITEKQRTVAAYFSGQKSPTNSQNSPQNISEMSSMASSNTTQQSKMYTSTSPTTTKRTSINRIKTSHKASISNQNPSSGLVRSQTMPHIPNVRLLDESNVEDAFEQILKCS